MLFEEVDRIIHQDDRALSLALLDLSHATQVGIVVEKVEADHPFIEAHATRIAGGVGLSRTQMHFAENAGDISGRFQCFSDGLLLRAHVAAMVGDFGPNRVPPGHHAGTGR